MLFCKVVIIYRDRNFIKIFCFSGEVLRHKIFRTIQTEIGLTIHRLRGESVI